MTHSYQLLTKIPTVTAPHVISLLTRSSPYSHGMRGPEERDALFARLFGLTAIIRSGALFASNSSGLDQFETVIAQLVILGQAKGWLRESAWWVIIDAVTALLASTVEWKHVAIEGMIERVFGQQNDP